MATRFALKTANTLINKRPKMKRPEGGGFTEEGGTVEETGLIKWIMNQKKKEPDSGFKLPFPFVSQI